LPIPEPTDKHDKALPPASRYARPWTWDGWRTWLRRSWDRTEWRNKKDINRMVDLRNRDPANRGIDWSQCSEHFNAKGAIYAIYHFTSGRWYVGQTVNEIHKRAQAHWWSRTREDDLFHQAMLADESPFSFVALPL
jgi:hypothetical protein